MGDIVNTLIRRRIVVFSVLGLCLIAGIVVALRPRSYQAEGVLRIQTGVAGMYRSSPATSFGGNGIDKIATDARILQSRTLYLQVAKELDLIDDEGFTGKKNTKHETLDDPRARENIVRMMDTRIRVQHTTRDEIVTITCSTGSPLLSAKIVNTLINDYVSYLFQMQFGSTQRSSGWLLSQLKDLKQQVEQDQTELTELQKKLGIVGFGEGANADYLAAQSLNSLTKAVSDATIERIIAESKLRYLQSSDPNLVEGEVNLLQQEGAVTQNGLLANLRNSRAQAASAYAKLQQQFGANYPAVKQQKAELDELDREVDAEQRRIVNQATLSYNAASSNEKLTEGELSKKRAGAFDQHNDMIKYVLLMHDYESHRQLYETLVQRLREAGITSGLEAGEVDIVDLADLPALPQPPGRKLILLAALLAGCLLGCFVAILWDSLDSKITSPEDAERYTGLPLLGSLPHLSAKKSSKAKEPINVKVFSAAGSHYDEAISSLRSAILLGKAGPPPKVLLICSSLPAEGKSTTSINLAATFAKHNSRTLLIEADLRRGSDAPKLGLSNLSGITNVLTGQITIDQAIQAVPDHENLFALLGGPRPPDPAILTGSPEMAQLIQECKDRFDVIVIDAPPLIGLSDTRHLAQLADTVILIIRENQSNKKATKDSIEILRLSGRPAVGFVLNDIDRLNHGYGYGYGKYYGAYYNDDK